MLREGVSMPRLGQHLLSGMLMALLPGIIVAPGASAQQADRPVLLPQTDVAVIYRIDNGPIRAAHRLQVTYTQGGERVRVDLFRWMEAKVPYRSIIFDRPADRLTTVLPEQRAYTVQPIGSVPNPGAFLTDSMVFARQAKAVVARAPCTEWEIVTPHDSTNGDKTCVTDDGVMLRVSSTRPSVASMTAVAIHFGAPPDGMFEPPDGFHRQTQP